MLRQSSAAILLTAIFVAACGAPGAGGGATPTPSASSRAPASSPTPGTVGPLGVLVQRAGGGEPYVIQLVRPDGRALPAVHAMARSLKTYLLPASACPSGGQCTGSATANYQLPETSVSATRVYFLDGEADLKALSPTGRISSIRHLEVPANSNVAFAVSPDDRRIAVAMISYGTSPSVPPFSLHLYVEDLGGGKRGEEFTSTSIVEWPVGWRGPTLVVANGQPGVFTGFNPYGAVEYHLVDPATWTRQAALTCSYGPIVAAGVACWTPTSLGRQDWTGVPHNFRIDPAGALSRIQPAYLALSPDGRQVAAALKAAAAGTYDTELFEDGSEAALVAAVAPLGWLDGGHLLVVAPSGLAIAAIPGGALTTLAGVSPLPGQGWPSLFGTLPVSLG